MKNKDFIIDLIFSFISSIVIVSFGSLFFDWTFTDCIIWVIVYSLIDLILDKFIFKRY